MEQAILDGMTLLGEGRANDAIHYFENLVADNPNSARAHLYLAFSYDGDGRESDAVPHYERAIASSIELEGDELRDAYVCLGSSYRELDDPTAAAATLRDGIGLFPTDTVLPTFLALVLHDTGNDGGALRLMGEVALHGGIPDEWRPALHIKFGQL